MAKRARTILACVKRGDFGLLDKTKKSPIGTKRQQNLEDLYDDEQDQKKPRKKP